MSDPYKVIGVGRGATMLEIKEAYRALAKKYHPDNYNGSPLRTVAEQKMAEINQAFDQIKQEREWDDTANTSTYAGQQGAGPHHHSTFPDIRGMIRQNRLEEAEALLQGVPPTRRDAEWYFLQATIYFSRGWLNEAATHFARAHQMQQQNPEYRAAFERIQWQMKGNFGAGASTTGAGHQYAGGGGAQCNVCNLCAGLVCLDCCCECAGGDLIACC